MLLFVIQIIEIKNVRIIKIIIYSIFIIMFIIFIPAILLWNKILLLCGGILYGLIIGTLIIYPLTKLKKLKGSSQKIIISIFFILVLSMLEYFFRIKEFTSSSYLPLGLFSFVSYLLYSFRQSVLATALLSEKIHAYQSAYVRPLYVVHGIS